MTPWILNWLERHESSGCRWLHAVGVPLLLWGLVTGAWQLAHWQLGLWWRPVGLFAISYILQWIGHLIEGNDMGEVILIKKLAGRPYVAIAPRYQPEKRFEQKSKVESRKSK